MRGEDGKNYEYSCQMQDKCRRERWWLHCWNRGGLLLFRARGAQGFPWAWHELASITDQYLNTQACFLLIPKCVSVGHDHTSWGWYKYKHSGVVQDLSWNSKDIPSALSPAPALFRELRSWSRTQMTIISPHCLGQDNLSSASNPGADRIWADRCWAPLSSPNYLCWDRVAAIPISLCLMGLTREKGCVWVIMKAFLKTAQPFSPNTAPHRALRGTVSVSSSLRPLLLSLMVADNWRIWKTCYGHVSWQGTSLLSLISLHFSYLICFLFDWGFLIFITHGRQLGYSVSNLPKLQAERMIKSILKIIFAP